MNAFNMLLHAYQSIAALNPEKSAVAVITEVEDIARRFTAAVKAVEAVLPTASAAAPEQTQG